MSHIYNSGSKLFWQFGWVNTPTQGANQFEEAGSKLGSEVFAQALPDFRSAQLGKTRLAVEMIDAGLGPRDNLVCAKLAADYVLGEICRVRSTAQYVCPHAFWDAGT